MKKKKSLITLIKKSAHDKNSQLATVMMQLETNLDVYEMKLKKKKFPRNLTRVIISHSWHNCFILVSCESLAALIAVVDADV